MLRAYSQEQRRFARLHKPDPVMKQDLVQSKILGRGIGKDFHLMIRHGSVSFIVDSFNLTTVFQFSNDTPEIDHRSGGKIDIFLGRFQMRFSQQNLRNGICHAFESALTM